MAEMIELTGDDGFRFAALHEQPSGPRKGGVIVLQEVFGIDRHVRADVAAWAAAGYEAIAPSLFDRFEPGFTAEHDDEGIKRAIAARTATRTETALADIAACRDFLKAHGGKVYAVGYCYGGSLAWLAAAKLEGLAATSSYYGSMVQANAALTPKCPVVVHLGRDDANIPADEVAAAVSAHNPDVPVHIYEGAGHGFNNQSPERYNPQAAKLARQRTLDLFEGA